MEDEKVNIHTRKHKENIARIVDTLWDIFQKVHENIGIFNKISNFLEILNSPNGLRKNLKPEINGNIRNENFQRTPL